MGVELEVQRATNLITTPDDGQFRCWVDHAIKQSEHDQMLVIRIVDEDEGRRFNQQFRCKDYATNVLSFPMDMPEGLPAEIVQSQLGDLLICAPVVAREAAEQGKPEINHWAHLTIHGVLHLLGYDHEQPDDAQLMEALETDILASLDIPNPYETRRHL